MDLVEADYDAALPAVHEAVEGVSELHDCINHVEGTKGGHSLPRDVDGVASIACLVGTEVRIQPLEEIDLMAPPGEPDCSTQPGWASAGDSDPHCASFAHLF
jgi:hypothetical protein